MGILDGKVAVVTGAGRGAGRSHALGLARAGAKVLVNDVGLDATSGEGGVGLGRSRSTASAAQQVADEIVAAGGDAMVDDTEVGGIAGATVMIGRAVRAFGGIDIVVNTTGAWSTAAPFDLADERFCAEFATHVTAMTETVSAAIATVGAAVTAMREAGQGGRIINTVAALRGTGGMAVYRAARTTVASFTLTAAVECEPYGITVNALSPDQDTRLVVYLASAAAAGITGRFFQLEATTSPSAWGGKQEREVLQGGSEVLVPHVALQQAGHFGRGIK